MPSQFDFEDSEAPRRSTNRNDDDLPSRRNKSRNQDDDDDDEDRTPRRRYQCRYCGSRMAPVFVSKISPLGWVVFCFGLFFAIIGCLLGLLFKHNVKLSPECNHRL